MNWDEIWQGSIMTSRKFGALGNGGGGGKGWGIKRVGATPNPITRFLSHAQTSTKPHEFERIIV